MQERAMKGVEPVRHLCADGTARAGVWLSLEALLALPLLPAAQLELLAALLELLPSGAGAESESCRAALLAALWEGELRQACGSFETGAWQQGRAQWQAAVAHHHELQGLRPASTGLDGLLDGLIQVLARLDQALTHRQWRPPASPLDNAQVHGIAAELLQQIRDLDRPLPSWYEVVEEGLLRRGGLALLQQASAACRRDGLALLLRWRQRQPTQPDWLAVCLEQSVISLLADLPQSSHPRADLQALLESLTLLPAVVNGSERQAAVRESLAVVRGCLTLAAAARQPLAVRESLGLERGAVIAPPEIRVLVREWLEDHPAQRSPVALELVWIPGARPLPHGHGQLALNLAAVLPQSPGHPALVEQVMASFFEPLLQIPSGRLWQQRHSIATLLSSLSHFWAAGGALSASECRQLALAQEQWQHWGGPGRLGAQQHPAQWPPARLGAGCCLVQPSALQLAGLRCWLQARPEVGPALAEIRRRHHDPVFLQQRAACAAGDRGDALETLCALQLEEGFYGSNTAPDSSFQAWAHSSLTLLSDSELLLDSQPPIGSWWAVLQGLAQGWGGLPDLVAWPEDQAVYDLLAGQEVLLISPLAALAEEQHRSGRAFQLFLDLPIAPYGLRTLVPPDSLYPRRPHQGFEASLEACLESVGAMVRERPFTVLLTAAGVYDLPLCHAARERYGAACVAIGPAIHARLGIDQACSRHWRSGQRRADRWRRIC
jgi:hypothetical protein